MTLSSSEIAMMGIYRTIEEDDRSRLSLQVERCGARPPRSRLIQTLSFFLGSF